MPRDTGAERVMDTIRDARDMGAESVMDTIRGARDMATERVMDTIRDAPFERSALVRFASDGTIS